MAINRDNGRSGNNRCARLEQNQTVVAQLPSPTASHLFQETNPIVLHLGSADSEWQRGPGPFYM